ncbi:MAG: hypothetical protein AB2692_19355 [Candidatus Thiodiazotropha sp.]
MILYRGVSNQLHERKEGRLIPKESGPFQKPAVYGKAEYGNSFYGNNEKNAVVEHQLHQAGYATSGISTTPHIERAKYYATHGGKHASGIIYEIDSELCKQYEVSIFEVAQIVPIPSIPEDSEFILVAKEFGELPIDIIINVYEFKT